MFIGCNVGKRKKVHYDNCIYCQRSEQKNRVEYETLDAALEDDAKPCKHCLTMNKQIKAEFEKMNAFAKNFNLKFTNQNGLIYIKDGMGKWKLVPADDGNTIYLFHKNTKQCVDESKNSYFIKYHKHKEEFTTIVEAMEYIVDHLSKYLTMPNLPQNLQDRAKSIIYKDTKRYKKKANKARDSHTRYLKRCDKREAVNNVFKIMATLKTEACQTLVGT